MTTALYGHGVAAGMTQIGLTGRAVRLVRVSSYGLCSSQLPMKSEGFDRKIRQAHGALRYRCRETSAVGLDSVWHKTPILRPAADYIALFCRICIADA